MDVIPSVSVGLLDVSFPAPGFMSECSCASGGREISGILKLSAVSLDSLVSSGLQPGCVEVKCAVPLLSCCTSRQAILSPLLRLAATHPDQIQTTKSCLWPLSDMVI